MQKIVKVAFRDTLPVMTGYLVLGFGFGLLLKANG
jgi:predicted branched-subunit amino acid permease